ncbi:MAG: gamma-glutamyltransferase [Armatimonadota bacterium]|nr:gamma-glutamyltransferase [Armatimonadota bacterium]MDR7466076.1 gamma-glutamyltransferase [Armatimonadota bacterium]MDR7493887.1 gamma-glutamyltransferase [Armatimonadota bacterium]MDR7498952.1 gamma-glutamyltransferase [Armatimonadota bacterium]MDR7546091.1 gamma-glutamyltransferase [Armatimonadota bacterium]
MDVQASFRTGRAPVFSPRGIIATGHPLASAAGLHVLMRGGNAVDAALAAAGVLGVVQPMMSGLGGDTFIVLWRAAERRAVALNGSGVAPYAATAEWFRSRGYTTMPLRGMLSVSVPGAVDAMTVALARWGSGRFTLGQLLEPAMEYAAHGFPVAERVAQWIRQSADVLARYPSSARIYLPDGRTPQTGQTLRNPDLARSLRLVAEGGAEVFYRGELARRLVRYCREHGGLLGEREFAEHVSEVYEPIRTTYRGITVCTTAPPSQGVILLEMLNILEGFPPEELRWGAARAVHLMVEAKKLAVADRLAYLGDPRQVRNPLDTLLSKEFASRRRRAIDPGRAQAVASAGALPETVGDTTYLCAADAEGNVVSFITSLSAIFGCGEVVEGTGILLNNRAGRGFTLEEGHPNCIAPGKRTMHTLMPFLALREDAPWLAWGTPGGDGQPQWNLQAFSAVVDSGIPLQAAVELPRWTSFPTTDPAILPAPFELRAETGFPEGTLRELEAMGHAVRHPEPDDQPGGMQALLLGDGVYIGASDPRVDGCAVGF